MAISRPLALVALLLATAGCGAIQTTSNLLDADIQLEAARTAGAERYAPYPFTAAALYLHQARREAGFSNYDAAVDFARKASRFAAQAKQQSLTRTRNEP